MTARRSSASWRSQDEARLTLADLRDLAQGIHPSVLSDRGLVEAVEDRVSRMPDSVGRLQVSDGLRSLRFSAEVEGAAYFTICEAIANAMKHASAKSIHVQLRQKEGQLLLEVEDDGVGFEPADAARSGLRGLEDRVAALGGVFEVRSEPGRGTRIVARLPAQAASLA